MLFPIGMSQCSRFLKRIVSVMIISTKLNLWLVPGGFSLLLYIDPCHFPFLNSFLVYVIGVFPDSICQLPLWDNPPHLIVGRLLVLSLEFVVLYQIILTATFYLALTLVGGI